MLRFSQARKPHPTEHLYGNTQPFVGSPTLLLQHDCYNQRQEGGGGGGGGGVTGGGSEIAECAPVLPMRSAPSSSQGPGPRNEPPPAPLPAPAGARAALHDDDSRIPSAAVTGPEEPLAAVFSHYSGGPAADLPFDALLVLLDQCGVYSDVDAPGVLDVLHAIRPPRGALSWRDFGLALERIADHKFAALPPPVRLLELVELIAGNFGKAGNAGAAAALPNYSTTSGAAGKAARQSTSAAAAVAAAARRYERGSVPTEASEPYLPRGVDGVVAALQSYFCASTNAPDAAPEAITRRFCELVRVPPRKCGAAARKLLKEFLQRAPSDGQACDDADFIALAAAVWEFCVAAAPHAFPGSTPVAAEELTFTLLVMGFQL